MSYRMKRPKLRLGGTSLASGVDVAEDWAPRVGDKVHMVHSNGTVQQWEIEGPPIRSNYGSGAGSIYITRPMSGARQVWLKDGRMRTAPMWQMDQGELEAIRENFRKPDSG